MGHLPTRKRIVLATYGSPGDLYPFLSIGTELRARGHDTVVATSEMYRQLVLAAELGFAAVRSDRVLGQQDPDFLDRLRSDGLAPGSLFRAMFLPALRDSLGDLLGIVRGANVVVSHPLAPAARLAAETERIPGVSVVMQPMGYLSAHEPPVVAYPWIAVALRRLGPRATGFVMRGARRLTAEWTREWHELRAELGLPPNPAHPLWEGQHAPARSLGLFPRSLGESQSDWPAQARVTGYPFFRPPGRSLDPQVAAFLANGEPPLIFTLGTTAVNEPRAFFDESAAASRYLGRRALLLVGPNWAEWRRQASGDLLAVPSAPHDLVFPHAAAIVHQGGIGTLSEALLAGKPMLIMPYGHDQFDNAWRACRLGVARSIARRRYRAGTVSRQLGTILADCSMRAAAGNACGSIALERGASAAADLIEEVLMRPVSG